MLWFALALLPLGTACASWRLLPIHAQSRRKLADYRDKLVCIPHCLKDAALPDEGQRPAMQQPGPSSLFAGVLRYYKASDLPACGRQLWSTLHRVVVGEGLEGWLRQEAASRDWARPLLARLDTDKQALYAPKALSLPSHQAWRAFGMTLLEGAQAAAVDQLRDLYRTSYQPPPGNRWWIPPADPAPAQAINTLDKDDAQSGNWAREPGSAGHSTCLKWWGAPPTPPAFMTTC
jgi:hypothetical protein